VLSDWAAKSGSLWSYFVVSICCWSIA